MSFAGDTTRPARTRPRTRAAAFLLLSGAALLAVAAPAASAAVPLASSPPTIAGTPAVGQTLSASPGTWSGTTPITFTYIWQLCDATGGSCTRAGGPETSTHLIGSPAAGKTLRVRVIAANADGQRSSTSVPTAVVTSSTPTTTAAQTTTAAAPPSGCGVNGGTVPVADVALPAYLSIDQTQISPASVTFATHSMTVRIHVSACGGSVQGALVYVTAVPYGQFSTPNEQPTGSDGWATLQFSSLAGFPVSQKQELLVLFVRATAPNQSVLGGISARRLVSFRVSH